MPRVHRSLITQDLPGTHRKHRNRGACEPAGEILRANCLKDTVKISCKAHFETQERALNPYGRGLVAIGATRSNFKPRRRHRGQARCHSSPTDALPCYCTASVVAWLVDSLQNILRQGESTDMNFRIVVAGHDTATGKPLTQGFKRQLAIARISRTPGKRH